MDPLNTLADLSGVSTADMKKIWEDVKANHKRMAECDNHIFFLLPGDNPLRNKYECKRCGGIIDGIAYLWYTEGRKHEAKVKSDAASNHKTARSVYQEAVEMRGKQTPTQRTPEEVKADRNGGVTFGPG